MNTLEDKQNWIYVLEARKADLICSADELQDQIDQLCAELELDEADE